MVKTLPSGMQADLDSGSTTYCLCWKVTRTDAAVLGFTDHDVHVTFDSVTYEASTGFSGSAISAKIGTSVDELEVSGGLSSDAITEEDIQKRLYDNAEVEVYFVNWENPTYRILLFKGFLGTLSRSKLFFKTELRSQIDKLNQPAGRTYQKICDADLGDSRCTIDFDSNATYKITGTVSAGYSRRLFASTTTALIARPANWFTNGKLVWTSGTNAGLVCEVKVHNLLPGNSTALFDLWELCPASIDAGDGFTVYVGCDKTIETCNAKFSNVLNFRGFPRIPGQDIALQTASSKDVNDGSSWY